LLWVSGDSTIDSYDTAVLRPGFQNDFIRALHP